MAPPFLSLPGLLAAVPSVVTVRTGWRMATGLFSPLRCRVACLSYWAGQPPGDRSSPWLASYLGPRHGPVPTVLCQRLLLDARMLAVPERVISPAGIELSGVASEDAEAFEAADETDLNHGCETDPAR